MMTRIMRMMVIECGGGMATMVRRMRITTWKMMTGRLRVAILADMVNFDPAQFSSQNFPLIKSFGDLTGKSNSAAATSIVQSGSGDCLSLV